MALYHKWGVNTGIKFALQFFMLISDGLGGVILHRFKVYDCKCFQPVQIDFETILSHLFLVILSPSLSGRTIFGQILLYLNFPLNRNVQNKKIKENCESMSHFGLYFFLIF